MDDVNTCNLTSDFEKGSREKKCYRSQNIGLNYRDLTMDELLRHRWRDYSDSDVASLNDREKQLVS